MFHRYLGEKKKFEFDNLGVKMLRYENSNVHFTPFLEIFSKQFIYFPLQY